MDNLDMDKLNANNSNKNLNGIGSKKTLIKNNKTRLTDSNLLDLSELSSDTFGVIGVCGVVGNLVARVLLDHGLKVIGTDSKSAAQCPFKYTFENYNVVLELDGHPESFFEQSTYIIPPPSLSQSSSIFKKIKNSGSQVLGVEDILKIIKPEKPVICITGTNGKTTTTSLLKHICSEASIKPTEHGFKELQGNIDYIPPLESRLNGDVAILETGTFGVPGDLKFIVERSEPDCGIITNITPDHLPRDSEDSDQAFLNYALIKGEFVEYLKDKLLIINADDPTVCGLVKSVTNPDSSTTTDFGTSNSGIKTDSGTTPSDTKPDSRTTPNSGTTTDSGSVITFGVDDKGTSKGSKLCWCGKKIILDETISGMGYYHCECGLERPEPHYLATDLMNDGFTLKTPEGFFEVRMPIKGLHNVYNALGAIAAAREFLKMPFSQIIAGVETFRGVPGRLDYVGQKQGKEVIIDYAHNPGGVETVLQELKKIHDRIAVVITISSESGEPGDVTILKRSLEIADFIIPASFYSRNAADKLKNSVESEEIEIKKIKFTSEYPEEFKNGTLGATLEQVMIGLEKALECDVSAVICVGEAAFKYKEDVRGY